MTPLRYRLPRHPNWPFGQSYGGAKNSSCVDSIIPKIEDIRVAPLEPLTN